MTKNKTKIMTWCLSLLLAVAVIFTAVQISRGLEYRKADGPPYREGAVEFWAPDGSPENHVQCVYQWDEISDRNWSAFIPDEAMDLEYRCPNLYLNGELKYRGPVTVILFGNDLIIEQYGTGGKPMVFHEETGPEEEV